MLTLHRAASFASRAGQLSSNVRPHETPALRSSALALLQALPNTWHCLQNGLPTALNSLWPLSLRTPGPIALLLHSRRGRRRQRQCAHRALLHRCTGSSASPQHLRSAPLPLAVTPVRPNHSLKLTPHGLQNWPRSAYVHAAPRGQFRKPRGSA